MNALKIDIRNILSVLLLLSMSLMAGETGKIGGQITDKETGEPIVGANVVVEGMLLGASTDLEGAFFILQVPPGKYQLTITYLGYRDMELNNVTVMVDHTTRLDVEMEAAALELDEKIVVTAERPFIQKDVTSSTNFVAAETIEMMPVADLQEGVFQQAGVLFDGLPATGGLGGSGKGEARYSIRGGSQDEVLWFIDGIKMASLIDFRADRGGSFTTINKNSVQELQIITGGYNAEYGNAQSGIVNVITKTGGTEYSGSVEYEYGLQGKHHFGPYIYDRTKHKEFLDHTLEDGTLDPAWWTPHRQKQVYDYRKIPDHQLLMNLGGPLFKTKAVSATFYISSMYKEKAYNFPSPRDTRDLVNFMASTSFMFSGGAKLKIQGLYNLEKHRTLQQEADFTHQAKYYRGWGSLLDTRTTMLSASWFQALNNAFFYDLKLSWTLFDFKEKPSEYAVEGKSENPSDFGYQRYNGYGDEPFDAYGFFYDNHSQTGDISLLSSASWQFNNENLFKSGFELRYNTVNEIKALRYPSFSYNKEDWFNRGLHEKFHPIQFAWYFQDKMEFEGMILNAGVRYDYFNPNRDWFTPSSLYNLSVDPEFDPSLDPDKDQLDSNGNKKFSFENVLKKPREAAQSYHMFSPRLGVSFPVTENTLMHFNYGHYLQLPQLDRMFELTYFRPEHIIEGYKDLREKGTPVKHFPSESGDPERVVALTLEPLEPEKTIQFEVGIKHNVEDIVKVSATAYYKDVYSQSEPRANLFDRRVYGYDPFAGQVTPNTFYVTYMPGDYGDSRGFELSAQTLFSRNVILDLNYAFSVARQGRATPNRVEIDKNGNRKYSYDTEVALTTQTEKSFSRPHIMRANLFLNYPEDGIEPITDMFLHGSSLSILYKYISGQAFTYLGPNDPITTYNNHRYPSIHIFDLRAEKSLELWQDYTASVYVRVTNLFNTKNLRSFGNPLFDTNDIKEYVENGKISNVSWLGYDISYQTYYEPRRIYLGARFNF